MRKKLIIIILLVVILLVFALYKYNSSLKIEFVYKTNAGVPYEWQYEIKDKDIVKISKSYVIKDENKSGKTGAPIYTKYVFKGLKKGNTTIKFRYVNFVDKKVQKEDVYNVKVGNHNKITLVK